MIHFFRRLRKQLADDNKPLKYMRYAIGEIVLVVIGILIALSINNWNQERHLKIKERKLLVEIESNLAANAKTIKGTIERENKYRNEIGVLMDHFKMKKPFNDTIGRQIQIAIFMEKIQFTNSAYESLKTTGLDIISNDSIRTQVTQLFSNRFPYVEMWIRDAGMSISNSLNPVFDNYFEAADDSSRIPSDYQGALDDKELINILSRRKSFKRVFIEDLGDLLNRIEQTRSYINKELETFN